MRGLKNGTQRVPSNRRITSFIARTALVATILLGFGAATVTTSTHDTSGPDSTVGIWSSRWQAPKKAAPSAPDPNGISLTAAHNLTIGGTVAQNGALRVTNYPETSASIVYRGTWSRAMHPGYLGRRALSSNQRGASASLRFTGIGISWIGPTGPTRGEAKIYVDGRYVKTVDTYSPRFAPSRVLYSATYTTERQRTFAIVVLGTKGHPTIALDALVVRSGGSLVAPSLTGTRSEPASIPTPMPRSTLAPTPTPTRTPVPTPAPTPTPTPTATPSTSGVSLADYGGNWANAIEAAKTRGNIVNVPAGTWPAPRIFPYAGLTIRGAGPTQTFVPRNAPGALASGGFFHVTTANVTISDLTLRGWPVTSGPSDDILINGINATNLKVLRVNLENAQGAGIQTEGVTMTGALFEDITITNTRFRSNGAHGVALWPYKGTSGNTFRRITIDGANYAGIMIDAGTSGSTDAASVNDNVFEDIIIRRAGRNTTYGYGFVITGGQRNSITRWEITDQATGAALALGFDQSGIGSNNNTFKTGNIQRITSTDFILFGGTIGNTINGGTGTGHYSGLSGNTITNWPGLIP